MPLSEQEERAFAQIAAAIGSSPLAADPSEPRLRRQRLMRAGAEVCAVAAVTVLAAALFFPVGVVQVALLSASLFLAGVGAALYFGGGRRSRSFLARPFRRTPKRVPYASAAQTILPARKPLLKRLEDRWEQRYQERFGPR